MNGLDWSSLLDEYIAWYIPQLLVIAAGAFLAVRYWRRHPRVSMLALLGVILLLSRVGVGMWSYVRLEVEGVPSEVTFYELMTLSKSVRIIVTVLQMLGLICLIAAIFVDRYRAQEVHALRLGVRDRPDARVRR